MPRPGVTLPTHPPLSLRLPLSFYAFLLRKPVCSAIVCMLILLTVSDVCLELPALACFFASAGRLAWLIGCNQLGDRMLGKRSSTTSKYEFQTSNHQPNTNSQPMRCFVPRALVHCSQVLRALKLVVDRLCVDGSGFACVSLIFRNDIMYIACSPYP